MPLGIREEDVKTLLKSRGFLAVLLAGLFLITSLFYRLPQYPETIDHAYFDYYAIRIADGEVAHRDFFEDKTPLSFYLSALLIILSRHLGVDSLNTIRWGYLLLGGTTVALAFFILEESFRDRQISVIGSLMLGSFGAFSQLAISGTEPKIAMLLSGLLAIHATQRRRWYLAGVSSCLSGLFWQPGWSFGAVALLMPLATSPNRVRDAAKVCFGISLPILLAVGYFTWHGALRDFIWQTILLTEGSGGASRLRARLPLRPAVWLPNFHSMRSILVSSYHTEILVLVLAMLGIIAFAEETWFGSRLHRIQRGELLPVWLSTLTALAVLWDQGVLRRQIVDDTLIVLPFLAAFGAWFVVRTFQVHPLATLTFVPITVGFSYFNLIGISSSPFILWTGFLAVITWGLSFFIVALFRSRASIQPRVFQKWHVMILGISLLVYGTIDAVSFRLPFSRQDQTRTFQSLLIVHEVNPQTTVLALSAAEFLVLTGHKNALRYVYLSRVATLGFPSYERRPLDALTADLSERPPKLVLIRDHTGPGLDLIRNWMIAAGYRSNEPIVIKYPLDPSASPIEVWSTPKQ